MTSLLKMTKLAIVDTGRGAKHRENLNDEADRQLLKEQAARVEHLQLDDDAGVLHALEGCKVRILTVQSHRGISDVSETDRSRTLKTMRLIKNSSKAARAPATVKKSMLMAQAQAKMTLMIATMAMHTRKRRAQRRHPVLLSEKRSSTTRMMTTTPMMTILWIAHLSSAAVYSLLKCKSQ
jgi:hypothetical protein